MQAIRNGIKSAVRTPWKTLLYTLVLLLLAVMLYVAFCVNSSVRGYLDECDDYFHTVVKFEYVGADYPDNFVYDGELAAAIEAHRAELDALCSAPEVMSFEPAYGSIALVDGLHRKDRLLFDPEFAVIRISVRDYIGDNIDAYSAFLDTCLYSRADESQKLIMVRPEAGTGSGPQFEEGKSYLVCGRYFRGINSYVWFEAADISFEDEGGTVSVPAFTETDGGELSPRDPYVRLAAFMRLRNDSCPVQFTAALMDQIPFHEQELMLTEGRSFTDAEYASKAKVCVVSDRLASAVGVSPGDKLGLSLFTGGGDLYGRLAPEAASAEYEIVGIYGANDLHPYDVYLPDSNAANGAVRAANGYGLGVFRIKNSEAAAFTARAERLEPHGFRFSVYDQGYSAAAKPMNEMLFISTVFLGICLLLALAALCLQCYMFISRQREAARTMLALGSGKGHICLYFLACTAVVTLPAALLGCLAGKLLEGKVFGLMQSWLARMGTEDLRYSSSRLSLVRTLEFDPHAPASVFAAAALTILLGALVCALVFTAFGMRDRAKKPKKLKKARRMRAPMRSSHLRTRLKYALLSIRRSGLRTAAVVLLAAAAALFFGRLTSSLGEYGAKLDDVRENTVIRGHATDLYGQDIDGLIVENRNIEELAASGVISEYNYSDFICNLRLHGVARSADGTEHDLPAPDWPQSSFAIETFFAHMGREPDWLRTSSVAGSPRFYYSEPASVEWLEGYGEASFLEDEWICAMPQAVMNEHGVSLGDTVRFIYALYYRGSPVIETIDLKVAAAYRAAQSEETVFSPIGCRSLPAAGGEMLIPLERARTSYESFVFTLKHASMLPEARDALEEAGFTCVRSEGRGRLYAVIDDLDYLNTTGSMERQIRYVGALYDALYALAGVLGAVLAWLLVSARRPEAELMKALGAGRGLIVLNLFTEQALLCAAGLGLGLLIWRLIGGQITRLQLILSAAFFGLWALSALVCSCAAAGKSTCAGLNEPE